MSDSNKEELANLRGTMRLAAINFDHELGMLEEQCRQLRRQAAALAIIASGEETNVVALRPGMTPRADGRD